MSRASAASPMLKSSTTILGDQQVGPSPARDLIDCIEGADVQKGRFGDRRTGGAHDFNEVPPQMAPAMNKHARALVSLDCGQPVITVIAIVLKKASREPPEERLGMVAAAARSHLNLTVSLRVCPRIESQVDCCTLEAPLADGGASKRAKIIHFSILCL